MCSNITTLFFTSSSSFYFRSKIHLFNSSSISPRRNEPRMNVIASVNGGEQKVVVVMGGTGCGKSGLSVQLGSKFPSEIINCDKMQVYTGLDITTNKIPLHERHDVPHHILGDVVSDGPEFTPLDFRFRADIVVPDIVSRNNLPILVGGSNSFIHAMLVKHFDPNDDVFSEPIPKLVPDLRYRCCFLWLDVALPILFKYLSIRVDDMLELGMYEELADFYDPNVAETTPYSGIRKAIGVPEFDRYFRKYPPRSGKKSPVNDEAERSAAFEKAVNEIKMNTHVLAERQIEKILKMKRAGWDINVLNATEAVRAVVEPGTGRNREEIWRKQVFEPSLNIVKRFLDE